MSFIVLFQEYGTLAAAPMEIKGRIVEMEQLSMNGVCCIALVTAER